MKRSEFLDDLKDFTDQNLIGINKHDLARILSFFESKGIISPPKIRNPEYDSAAAAKYADHPFMEYPHPATIRAWEQE